VVLFWSSALRLNAYRLVAADDSQVKLPPHVPPSEANCHAALVLVSPPPHGVEGIGIKPDSPESR